MVGWLIALGVVCILLLIPLIPVGISAVYNYSGLSLTAHLGFLRFELGKENSRLKDILEPIVQEEVKVFKETVKKKVNQESGGKLSDFLPLLDAVWKLLGDLRRKIRVKRLDLNLILAGEDPCALALNYGKAWTAVGNLMPLLERIFVIKKRNIQVSCDFTGDVTRVYTKLWFTMPLGKFFSLLVKYGVPLRREYDNFLNSSEGGNENG